MGDENSTQQLEDELTLENYQFIKFFTITTPTIDTQAFLAKTVDSTELVLSFRGSEVTTGDILTGLQFRRDEYPEGQNSSNVHKGFLEAWYASKEDIIEFVKNNLGDMSFAIAGHSLGAGLATIAAYEFSTDDSIKKPITLYTIGSPRTGDRQFNKLLQKQHDEGKLNYLRVVYDQDWAAHLPPFFANPFFVHHNPTKMYKRRWPLMGTIRRLIYGKYYIKDEATIMKMRLGLTDVFPFSMVKLFTDVIYAITDIFRGHKSDHDKFGYLINIITKNKLYDLDDVIEEKIQSEYLKQRVREF